MRGPRATRGPGIVAELRIADALANGPRPVSDLARGSGADADMLHRSLRALASDGIFVEARPGVFGNTDASELLRSETGWSDFAHLCGGAWHRAAGELDADGRPTFERLYGTDFWRSLEVNPEERAAFDRAME